MAEDLTYGYTAIGQLSTLQYPAGSSVSYTYAADGKVAGLSVDGVPLIGQLQYQADGKIGQWTWGNGLIASRTFDADGRLTGYSKAASSASIAYDNVNRIVNLADTRGTALTQGYAYDPDDRLSNYLDGSMANSYLYDPDGNRTMQGNGSGFTNYLYAGDSNRLLQLSGSRNADLKYDADGNIVADGDNRYKYDGGGRLIEVRNGAGSTRYLYNPLGQRVAKLSDDRHGDADGRRGDEHRDDDERDHASGTATYYAFDVAGRLIGEYERERRQATEYVWMGNVPVAVLKREGDDPARLYYILTDHLGTPRQVVDSRSNAVVWEWFGEPFGTGAPDEDPGQTGRKFTLNLRYAGQYYDRESGLFHNGYRDYNPQLGRYVESDPIGLKGGINTYAYVRGNPVSFADPDGRFTFFEILGGIGTGWLLYKGGQAINNAFQNQVNTPGATDILNNPNTTAAAQQGQNNAISDMGNVGGRGSDIVYDNPISTIINDVVQLDKWINNYLTPPNSSAPNSMGNTGASNPSCP